MKRWIAMVMAMLLMTASAMAELDINPTDIYVGRWQDERVADAVLTILPEYVEQEGNDYLVLFPTTFVWKRASGERIEWTMTARFNETEMRLEYTDGVKIGGDRKQVWSDAKGILRADSTGALSWTDQRETDSVKLSFARVMSPTPTPQEFVDGYFSVVAGLERGSAGAAAKAAQAIVSVLQFAEARDLWNADGEEVQRNMNAAWESLSDDEKARFGEVFFDGVSDPADEAFDDYDAVRGVFKDAGVGDEMARLVSSPEVELSWELMSSATLNINAIDEDMHGDAVG